MNKRELRQLFKDTDCVRRSGTAEELRTAEYLRERCERLGAAARLESFPVPMGEMEEARVFADGKEIPCRGFFCCGSGEAEAGMARVTSFAASIGCNDTQHNRLMMDFNGKENYTTAKDCAIALRMIYKGQYVTPTWSAEMLSIMKGQVDHSRIHRLLPKGTEVADKPGSLYEHSNGDVGIVFSPAGDYIICMISNEFQSTDAVKDNMAKLSLEVYNWFQKKP